LGTVETFTVEELNNDRTLTFKKLLSKNYSKEVLVFLLNKISDEYRSMFLRRIPKILQNKVFIVGVLECKIYVKELPHHSVNMVG
jgi:hypothetical protein